MGKIKRYFSLFSGVGGFDIALTENNWKCIGYSEIDKNAIQIYEKHFKHRNYGDATKIDYKKLSKYNLLVGGTPCQDFTILGKQKGITGEKSRLFAYFIKALKESKPDYFIFENVRGCLSSNEGWDFAHIQIEFTKCGYDIQWQVLNSKNFGLAQSRQRVYIVGCLRGKSCKEIFPIKTTSEATNRRIKEVHGGHHRYRTYSPKGISPTLTAFQKAGYARVKLQTGKRTIRELTELEYERLQGFPDNWTKGIDKYERYACMGNAVSVNVIRELIKKL